MAFLRCDACGAKALRIATRCPSCTQPFPLVDDRGERLRWRACARCESLVARDATSCRWCGSELRSGVSTPAVLGGGVILAASLAALLLLRSPGDVGTETPVDRSPSGIATTRPAPEVRPSPSPPAIAPAPVPEPSPDGTDAPSSVRAEVPPTPGAGTGTMAALEGAPAPGSAEAPARIAEEVSRSGPPDEAWDTADAITFVNVRVAPGTSSEILGVVPENARVRLGPFRGGWRRIVAGSMEGWADSRLFRIAGS